MMFFASQLNVVCRKTSRNGMAFMFSSTGLFTACWFVMGLMGIHLTLEAFTQFWSSARSLRGRGQHHAGRLADAVISPQGRRTGRPPIIPFPLTVPPPAAPSRPRLNQQRLLPLR